ncbi:LuxR C-terminal-related transcriptional regulator [Enemella sp. A6]|uniref:LuxR C-terminal-related transcriptional regulator n=1 Tax=Enemella sp. A6 TaxID=3440152 RepID=UPI003EB71643
MSEQHSPISVALVNDYPVIVEGVARMLEPYPGLRVVELDSLVDPARPVDVVLFDAFASKSGISPDVSRLVRDPRCGRVVIYSWNVADGQVREALDLGAHGYLSKSLDAQDLAAALCRAHAGEQVVEPAPAEIEIEIADWPGRSVGLTAREAEVVALITQGITNDEIARHCYLSINSVKSYIRSAYRKMGVQRRSQAVLWGIENGMLPRPSREIPGAIRTPR